MNDGKEPSFGSGFERVFVGLTAMAAGAILAYLAVLGPLFLGTIKYRSAEVINNQLVGQDLVNMFLLAPILTAGGLLLLLKKGLAKHLLIATPLFLIYYALSYTVGWEWSSPAYGGDNERYTFLFLFILVAALIILLYSLAVFPKDMSARFKKKGLAAYSALFSLLLVIFAAM